MSGKSDRKRKKGYYKAGQQGKRRRHGSYLEPGLKGFLITCNNREKETVREAYNVLGEYAEMLYGPEQLSNKPGESSSDDEDIESALKKEVASIKETKPACRRFQVIDSGAKNCVFIKTKVEHPKTLVHKLLSDVLESQKAQSRYMMRIHPVMATCKADIEHVQDLVEKCIAPFMQTTIVKSYCILIKVRNNTDFGKMQIFPIMRHTILDMNPLHTFDDQNPEFVFHMDVIKNICCLSVMEDFYKFRKYNIQELLKVGDVPKTFDDPTWKAQVVDHTEHIHNTSQDKDEAESGVETAGLEETVPSTTTEHTPPAGSPRNVDETANVLVEGHKEDGSTVAENTSVDADLNVDIGVTTTSGPDAASNVDSGVTTTSDPDRVSLSDEEGSMPELLPIPDLKGEPPHLCDQSPSHSDNMDTVTQQENTDLTTTE